MMDKYKELLERLDGVKHEIGLAHGEGYAWAAKVLDEAAAAIEELSEQNDNLREVADTANEYADQLLNVKRHESCIDCPLYDKDNHRCPRFNAVIPKAIEESQRAQCVESVEMRWVPSVQPEIIQCGQCKYAEVADKEDRQDGYTCQFHRGSIWFSGSYCSWAERRQE